MAQIQIILQIWNLTMLVPWAESLNSRYNSAEYAIDEENSKRGDRLLSLK